MANEVIKISAPKITVLTVDIEGASPIEKGTYRRAKERAGIGKPCGASCAKRPQKTQPGGRSFAKGC